ncbi:efflux RND transporter periplasmic adaptor subunit [Hymenobacter terricola]|uniref:efflux RND transporter periplasmic adaptor subunit n=1 Tax=Hymenobacter terricola TaxID=2819236 RepID=UPI001B312CA4|nr:efflux RND transporter periplasmic adaptor subunit [Hymenobacter terricola]
MKPKQKILVVGTAVGLLALGCVRCAMPTKERPGSAVAVTAAAPDSTEILAAGVVGAGGEEPVPARISGRIRQLFFAESEYVHRGQLLVKLYTRNYVLAPHDGFLGPRLVSEGQEISPATRITTISRLHHLVVTIKLPRQRWGSIGVGDSVSVWVADRPTRVVTGVVSVVPAVPEDNFPVEIALTLRAPFRIGEQALVRLQNIPPTPAPAPSLTTDAK